MEQRSNQEEKELLAVIQKLLNLILFLLFVVIVLLYFLIFGIPRPGSEATIGNSLAGSSQTAMLQTEKKSAPAVWTAPDTTQLPTGELRKQILYGKSLIANTALYLGPLGSVAHISNGMNCQNCHLDAGTRPYGNNYSAVASTYPKFRERSGKTEDIFKRVNDCLERSLNGKTLDSSSNEMKAIKAYITWLGIKVKKGTKPPGSGIQDLPFMDRAADPGKGELVFTSKCISCHAADGMGKLNADNKTYQYPPLWGEHSYNTGAGLYRLSRLAGYVKNNMPFGATQASPQLSDAEAWDVAAFVNSQYRPKGNISKDWPKLAAKPIDHPFGPYADSFTETQHKYGPFGQMAALKNMEKEKQKVKQVN